MRIIDPRTIRILLPVFRVILLILGYVFSAAFIIGGVVMTVDALSTIPEKNALTRIDGQVAVAKRVIRTTKPPGQSGKNWNGTYSIWISIVQDGQEQKLIVPEPTLQQKDIADLEGSRVTALVESMSDVWELKTPARTFFTYDQTRATQIAGKRLSVVWGPLFLAVGGLGIILLMRKRRG